MSILIDAVKCVLVRLNCYMDTLEKINLVTYRDRIRWRQPLYRSPVLFDREGNDRLGDLIAGGKPLMVARLGSVELSCLQFYLEKRCRSRVPYKEGIRSTMRNNAGFFPADDDSLDAFCVLFLEHLRQADLLGVWFNKYEHVICNGYGTSAGLVELRCLEPFLFPNPWSRQLAGKRVLVVHPFTESIVRQYAEKRELLFADPEVLPDFELKTVKAIQSIGGTDVGFPSWFDAYRHMCDQIATKDFDICLIGAGAYGLPLAGFAKSLGKQAVHMGGVTQLLFGIKGSRWERSSFWEDTTRLFNEHWTRPAPSETPANKEVVENGCYW